MPLQLPMPMLASTAPHLALPGATLRTVSNAPEGHSANDFNAIARLDK
jgi:hypothetical protein